MKPLKRTVAAFSLEPHQRRGLELIAKVRGVTHHEVTRRAVVAYVAATLDPDHIDRNAELLRTDAEPDLAAFAATGDAFPEAEVTT